MKFLGKIWIDCHINYIIWISIRFQPIIYLGLLKKIIKFSHYRFFNWLIIFIPLMTQVNFQYYSEMLMYLLNQLFLFGCHTKYPWLNLFERIICGTPWRVGSSFSSQVHIRTSWSIVSNAFEKSKKIPPPYCRQSSQTSKYSRNDCMLASEFHIVLTSIQPAANFVSTQSALLTPLTCVRKTRNDCKITPVARTRQVQDKVLWQTSAVVNSLPFIIETGVTSTICCTYGEIWRGDSTPVDVNLKGWATDCDRSQCCQLNVVELPIIFLSVSRRFAIICIEMNFNNNV